MLGCPSFSHLTSGLKKGFSARTVSILRYRNWLMKSESGTGRHMHCPKQSLRQAGSRMRVEPKSPRLVRILANPPRRLADPGLDLWRRCSKHRGGSHRRPLRLVCLALGLWPRRRPCRKEQGAMRCQFKVRLIRSVSRNYRRTSAPW